MYISNLPVMFRDLVQWNMIITSCKAYVTSTVEYEVYVTKIRENVWWSRHKYNCV